MSLKIDRVQLEIQIKNDHARQQLMKLEGQMKQLKKELRKLPEGTDKWIKKSNELKKVQSQYDAVIDKIGLTGLSMNELRKRQRDLNAVMRNLDPRTEEYKKLNAQLKQVNNRMGELRGASRTVGSSLKNMAGKFNHYIGVFAAFSASIAGIVFSLKNLIRSNAELSDSFADVRKTTGLADKGVKELYWDIKKIDTRTGNRNLLELARVAGKLGVEGRDNILGFVRAADKIKVALSEDLGGDVEEAIKQVGKIVDIFKIKEKFSLEEGMLKVGSAINALGASSTASEEYLVEFTKRVGGIAPNAKISAADILGLGATLDQLGQTSEVSSTVFGKLIVAIGKDIPRYAKLANKSIDDFSKMLNENANEALIRVLEGARSSKSGIEGMAESLKALGVDGQRSVGVIGVLSNNIELLREQQKLSNEEFDKGTSLTEEFYIKNNTLAARIDKLRKVFFKLITMPGMQNFASNLITGISDLIHWFQRNIKTLKILAKAIGIVLTSLISYKITIVALNAIIKTGIFFKKLYAGAFGVLTGQIKLATLAQKSFNLATKLNPVGLIVGTLSTAATAFLLFRNRVKETKNSIVKLKQENEKLNKIQKAVTAELINSKKALEDEYKAITDINKPVDERKRLLEKFMEKYKIYLGDLQLDIDKTNELKLAYDKINEGILTSIVLKQQQHETESLVNEYINLNAQRNKYLEDVKKGTIEWNTATDQEFKNSLSNIKFELSKLPDEYEKISASIQESLKGIDFSVFTSDYDDGDEYPDTDNTETKKLEQLNEKILDLRRQLELDQMESDKREIEQIHLKYQKLIDEAKGYHAQINELEKLRDKEIELKEKEQQKKKDEAAEKKNEEYLKKKHDLEDQIYQLGLSDDDREIVQVMQKYDKMIGLAEQYGLDVTTLYELMGNEIDAILEKGKNKEIDEEKDKNDQLLADKERMYSALGGVFYEFANLVGTEGEKMGTFQKALVGMQILMDTASAISSLTKYSEANPANWLNPFAAVAFYAAGLARIFANIAMAKELLKEAEVPQYYKGKYDVIGADDKESYNAHLLSNANTGLIKSPTILVGEKPEIIIDPATTRNLMANFPDVIAGINMARVPQFALGQYPVSSKETTPLMYIDPDIIALLKAILEANNKPFRGYVVHSDIRKADEIVNEIEEQVRG